MTQTDPSDAISKFQEEQIKLEKEKLKIEKEKLEIEKSKNRWTAVSIFASIVVASISASVAYYSTQDVQRQVANDAFELKVAEMVMSGTAHDAKNKMIALRTLFPKRDFGDPDKFKPDEASWGRA